MFGQMILFDVLLVRRSWSDLLSQLPLLLAYGLWVLLMKCPKCNRDYLVVSRWRGYKYLHPKLRDHFGRVKHKVYQCSDTMKWFDLE